MLKQNKKKKEVEESKEIEDEVIDEIDEVEQTEENKPHDYLEDLKRLQAEFENYKKRQNDSQKDLVRYAAQNIILQIIPVLDNFQMSTQHVPEDQKDNAWVTGIMYIQKQLENVLSENGIEEISVKIGDTFDPALHEAIESKECQHCEADHNYKNKIQKVVMNGYKIGDKVIRPVRVVVE